MPKAKVIIVARDKEYRDSLKKIFHQSGYLVVGDTDNPSTTLNLLHSRQPDLVVVDGDSMEISVFELFPTLDGDKLAAVVVLISQMSHHEMKAIKNSFVISHILKPIAPGFQMLPIEVALANYRRFIQMDQEINKLKDSLETRKLVEKAKGILMREMGVSESQAYKNLQKRSMEKRMPMKDVAQAIIISFE